MCWRPMAPRRASSGAAGQAPVRHRCWDNAICSTPRRCWRCPGANGSSSARSASTTERIRVMPNPIDLDEFDAAAARGAFRRRFGLGDRAPLVVFLGKMTPRKRVDVAGRAPSRSCGDRGAQLVIAGNDMGAGAETRRAGPAARPRAAARTSCGLLRGPRRLERWPTPTSSCIPRQDEIFGLVPLEALLVGHTGRRRRRFGLRRGRVGHRRRPGGPCRRCGGAGARPSTHAATRRGLARRARAPARRRARGFGGPVRRRADREPVAA